MDSSHDIIVNLLHNLGTRREIDQYLRMFSGVESARFAVVKVGGGILRDQLDELSSALSFLRRVGLCPVVVHGAGPQLSEELERDGISSEWLDGQRVTTERVLGVARRVFQREGAMLADALERNGVRARPIPSGVFDAEKETDEALGLVGRVTGVRTDVIRAAIDAGQMPVISPLGESAGGQILNINADIATRELALALRPRKVVFLTPTGGLLDRDGRVIPAVSLAEDFDRLMASGDVSGGMALKLREIGSLLDRLGNDSSVSITSPQHLACELFTHQGRGTLIRRGVAIREVQSVDELDTGRFTQLLERSFGRRLREDYLKTRTITRVFLAGDYTAAAVLCDAGDAEYLDKFAVTAEAQGAGIGASLWSRVREAATSLVWRSRRDNPINPWYFTRADGMRREGNWVVFWCGIEGWDAVRRCVDRAASQDASFIEGAAQEVVDIVG